MFPALQAKITGYITATSSAASPKRQGTSVQTTNPSFPSGMGTDFAQLRAVMMAELPWPPGETRPHLALCNPSSW